MSEQLRGTVKNITYHSSDSGYTVMTLEKKKYDEFVCVGKFPDSISSGVELELIGDWVTHAKYGKQFQASMWKELMPQTKEGIKKYLGSGLIPGIGPKTAEKIVNTFGEDTFEILDHDIGRLSEVKGIGKKTAKTIRKNWAEQKESKDVMSFLTGYGIPVNFSVRIFKEYGSDTIEVVKNNPYILADDLYGVGFKKADFIAMAIGFEKDGFARCKAGITYTLNQNALSGSTFAYRTKLIEDAQAILGVDFGTIDMVLDLMVERKDLIEDGSKIFLPLYYNSEVSIARDIHRILDGRSRFIFCDDLDPKKLLERAGMEYDSIQANAITVAVKSKVMVLTGGPGTGKTTTTKAILSAFKSFGYRIKLAAPTGRAAKRMSESTGMQASTIHRLLEYQPTNGFTKNRYDQIDADLIVIDESSMIDTVLMRSLLQAVKSSSKIIFIGDIDQLPSVGAGNVLKDMIESEVIPVVKLTKIFRQAMNSDIVMNSHMIINGNMPNMDNHPGTDFFFMTREEQTDIADAIVSLVSTKLPAYFKVPTSSIQVLSPMRKGATGVNELNARLQKAINPPSYSKGEVTRGGTVFRTGDRVMQIKNNYDKNVFNGDIGTICNIVNDTVYVRFYDDDSLAYTQNELDELVLSYSCTIHKSQGSEYPIVVIPISTAHYMMLQRNLLYTAVTRAKKAIVLVGTKKAVWMAVENIVVEERNTDLKDKLINFTEPVFSF